MTRSLLAIVALVIALPTSLWGGELHVGFATADVTPDVNDPQRPVWLAGYGPGRQATKVRDPIAVRTMVLRDGEQKVAFACADLIGLQYPTVQRIRAELADFKYVLVSSTHNHEAPDVIGIWGKTFVQRGVDDAYLDLVVAKTVAAIREAEKQAESATAYFGTAEDASLLRDSRLPDVRDGVLRVVRFADRQGKTGGLWVQWNCHPECLGSKNTELTADFVGATVASLKERYRCPVLYVSGAVGGLMAPPEGRFVDADGQEAREGDFAYARLYGEAVAALAVRAIESATPLELTPFRISAKPVAVPAANAYYRTARSLGILRRKALVWQGSADKLDKALTATDAASPMAVESEVAYLQLGELSVAGLPGEIYPELIYGKYPAQAEQGVDFPDAKLEPTLVDILPSKRWLLIGLANDELGYVIPRRQWDSVPPFAYDRPKGQYGEINSCGPEVAPILMRQLQELVEQATRF